MMDSPGPNSRLYRTYMYLETDRVPDLEFGYWPETPVNWIEQGFPEDLARTLADDWRDYRFEEYFGMDTEELVGKIPLDLGLHPLFEEQVLEEEGNSQVVRDENGVTARRWKAEAGESSIPHYLEFPVKNRADWEEFRERLDPADPNRKLPEEVIHTLRSVARHGGLIQTENITGFYGALRNFIGMENLSLMFYDDPDLVRDICEHWTELLLAMLRQIPEDIPVHLFEWWEDMAYNGGPLVSPKIFEEYMVPCYQRVHEELARHGCELAHVDCDGQIYPLVPGWLMAGVNIMFPLEVAGTDMYRLREEYGKQIRLRGGVDKTKIKVSRDAIDRELERLAPMLEEGGFVPHLDHLVPPDISLELYTYYREQKQKLIGKA
jgi:uroporphyrinogen decarboxylase